MRIYISRFTALRQGGATVFSGGVNQFCGVGLALRHEFSRNHDRCWLIPVFPLGELAAILAVGVLRLHRGAGGADGRERVSATGCQ